MHLRLWNRFALASDVFSEDPTPAHEGIVIALYAEFARAAHPDTADDLIALFCRRTSEIVEQMRDAA